MNDQLAGQVLEALNDKVDIDYGNMPANSTNYAPSSKNVTNCITEIPQDIKLELINGTLTLKAGSKVYVPNGAGVFNVVTVANDLVRTTNIGGIVFINSTGTSLYTNQLGSVYSGNSAPSSSGIWYDTASNLVKFSTNGQTWSGQYSFPIGIASSNDVQITNIDQVFNGFGYIGSVRYALPGIKWLSPDGRNEDGTVKSIFNTLQKVVYEDFASQREYIPNILGTGSIWTTGSYVESETEPSDSYSVWYRPSDNYVRVRVNNGAWDINRYIVCAGNFTADGTRVTKLNVKPVFSTLDYNNIKYIAHQGFPSDKYINLTLGASGSNYTAPADGYFCFYSANVCNSRINNIYRLIGSTVIGASGYVNFNTLPVSRGDVCAVAYSQSGELRFFYSNGSK